jgi:disulfide oxidoreductase YuzD
MNQKVCEMLERAWGTLAPDKPFDKFYMDLVENLYDTDMGEEVGERITDEQLINYLDWALAEHHGITK